LLAPVEEYQEHRVIPDDKGEGGGARQEQLSFGMKTVNSMCKVSFHTIEQDPYYWMILGQL